MNTRLIRDPKYNCKRSSASRYNPTSLLITKRKINMEKMVDQKQPDFHVVLNPGLGNDMSL